MTFNGITKYKRLEVLSITTNQNNKNHDFYQFNKLMPQIIERLSQNKPNALTVYMELLRNTDSRTMTCMIPQPVLAKKIHKSTRTVNRILNYLASKSYIAIARSGRANVYVLNPHLIWRSYGYRKNHVLKYIKFPTNVVLARSQNLKFFNDMDNYVKKHGRPNIDLSKVQQKSVTMNQDPNHQHHVDRVNSETGEIKNNNHDLKTAIETITNLKNNGLHLSPKHWDVYNFIINNMSKNYRLDMTGKQVYQSMIKNGTHISLRTVWRTLNSLEHLPVGKSQKPLLKHKRYGRYGRKSCLIINPAADDLTSQRLIETKERTMIKQLRKQINKSKNKNKSYRKLIAKKQPLNYNKQ